MTLAHTTKTIASLEPSAVDRFKGNLRTRAEVALDEVVFTVAPDDYRALCERVHLAGFDFPRCLSGTDMDWGLGVTLHLQSLETKQKVAVRTYVPYDQPKVPTVSDLWGGVEWHEREAYDLVGIHFTGHPDLRRILTEDHWTIHPLQRKYDTRGYLMSDWAAKPWPHPAPWEDGFTPFGAAAAPAAHAAPAKAAAPAAPKPAPEAPKAAVSSEATAPVAEVPSMTTPAAPTSSEVAPEAAKPAQTKERKKWEPKGGSSTPPPTDASSAPATSSETPAAVSSTPAPAEASSTPIVEAAPSAPAQNTVPDVKPETPSPTVSLSAPAVLEAPKAAVETPAEAPAAESTEDKPRNPKIKRWEPKS